MTETDVAALELGDFDIEETLRSFAQSCSWSFLSSSSTSGASCSSRPSLEQIEAECLRVSSTGSSEGLFWPVPRPMVRERYIVHAFSGRRRFGDFQHFVEEFQGQYPDFLVHTISLDLMVDPEWGDVSKAPVREFWINAIKQRMVLGGLAGPPCETWSQARGKDLAPDTESNGPPFAKGPRVVREIDSLWGKQALALREVRQLDVGNLLLLFTLEMLLHLAVEGGLGAVEHPAPPADESKASVWRLPILQLMASWPEFSTLDIAQGLWGAKSRKPTRLLLLNLPTMIPSLRHWQLTSTIPQGTSTGRMANGEWSTSSLKEYAPALCAGLAQGFLSSLQLHAVEAPTEGSEAFRRQVAHMMITDHGDCIGPDFAT